MYGDETAGPARYLAHGLDSMDRSLEKMFAKQEARKEKEKHDAQLASQLRKTLDLIDPEGKDRRAVVGLPDLQGELQGVTLKSAMRDREAKHAQFAAQQKFMEELAAMGQPAGDVPAPLSNEEFARRTRRVGIPELAGAASRTGYALDPREMGAMAEAIEKAQRPRFTPGTARPIEGLDDYMFVVQNEHGAGTPLPLPGRAVKPVTAKESAMTEYYKERTEASKAKRAGGEESDVPLDIETKVTELQQEILEDEAELKAGDAKTWIGKDRKARLAGNKARLETYYKEFPQLKRKGTETEGRKEGKATESTESTEKKKSPEQVMAEAQDAIKRGADPAAVKKRLKEKYGIELK